MQLYIVIAGRIAVDYKIHDMADGMRIQMLAMELIRQNHTVDSLKKTPGFLATANDINFTDEYLQELITIARDLKN